MGHFNYFQLLELAAVFALLALTIFRDSHNTRIMKKLSSLLKGKYKTNFFANKIKIEAVFQDQKFTCQWRQTIPQYLLQNQFSSGVNPYYNSSPTTDLLDIVLAANVSIKLVKVGFYRQNQSYDTIPSMYKKSVISINDPEFMKNIIVMPLYTPEDREYVKSFLSNSEVKKLIGKILDQGSLGISFDLDEIHAYIPFPHPTELNETVQQIYALLPTERQIADILRS